MSGSTQYPTYRFTNLPKTIKQANISELFHHDDRKSIVSASVGSCPYQPEAFNVATVTFDGERRVESLINDPQHEFQNIQVDDTFYGLTPLNAVAGTPKAEYELISFMLSLSLYARLPLIIFHSFVAITGLAGRAFGSWQCKTGHMWLRDYLPAKFPDCRFFTYGYQSKVRNSQLQASISGFAETFAREIARVRSESEVSMCK